MTTLVPTETRPAATETERETAYTNPPDRANSMTDQQYETASSKKGSSKAEHRDSEASNEDRIISIISSYGPERKWKTAWGLGNDTGLDMEFVRELIEQSPRYFETAPIEPCGVKLYRPLPSAFLAATMVREIQANLEN